MSQENVEVVRRFVDGWNETGEPHFAEVDPDVVWIIDPGAFLAGTYHGHDGFRTVVGRMAEVFDQVHVEVDDLVEAGDSVVLLGGFRVRGALSGATAPVQRGAAVFQLRDGKIVAYRSYLRKDEALEAVGLRE